MAWATFALFNVTGTWWVKNAHWSGTVATTIINGFLMALPFWAYYKASSALGEKRARFGLPFLWLCVEVLHQDWDVSFPWLDLGNGLATTHRMDSMVRVLQGTWAEPFGFGL